jgi:hypothetical protein
MREYVLRVDGMEIDLSKVTRIEEMTFHPEIALAMSENGISPMKVVMQDGTEHYSTRPIINQKIISSLTEYRRVQGKPDAKLNRMKEIEETRKYLFPIEGDVMQEIIDIRQIKTIEMTVDHVQGLSGTDEYGNHLTRFCPGAEKYIIVQKDGIIISSTDTIGCELLSEAFTEYTSKQEQS